MPPTSFGNSLPKHGILGHINPLLSCNALLTNLCARHLNGLVTSGSFLKAVFRGLYGAKGMIWFLMICNGPLRKHIKPFGTPCMIMVGLSGNELLNPGHGLLGHPYCFQFDLGGQRPYCDHE